MLISTPANLNRYHVEHYARLAAMEAQRLGLSPAIVVRTSDTATQPHAPRPGVYLGRFRHTHEHITRLLDEEE